MIKFEPLTPEKLIGLQPYFSLRPTDCAESHFAYHLLWRPYYETKYYADEKGLVWLQKIDYDEQATMVPVCGLGHMRENFDRLQAYFTAIGVKMHMYLVDEAALGAIRPDPERYEVLEDRDSFDYIYSGEEMRVLPGRKYSKMKNRISRFRRDYGETAEFVILNPEDEGEIRTFLERWSKNRESDDDLNRLDSEEQGIFETIRFGREAGITMAGVRIGGTLEAFSMGTMNQERNMTVTHVEKANLELRGLYNYLEKEFLTHVYPEVEFVNREDDMGLENLRRTKESMHPVRLEKKYTILER